MIEEQKGIVEAENTLEDLGFDMLPIIPEEVVSAISCSGFRVEMDAHDFTSNNILGKAVGNESAAVIVLNKNIADKGRFNFTAAHEIGHVCMHIMPKKKLALAFECGSKELSNSHKDPLEQQANGFASGLLMPKQLISKLTDGELNWENINRISSECHSSLQATFRRMLLMYKEPIALVIHERGRFKSFVASDSFGFFIHKFPLTPDHRELMVDVKEQAYPINFIEVDPVDWVDTEFRGDTLRCLYASSILLKDGYSYTLLTYDEDCLVDADQD